MKNVSVKVPMSPKSLDRAGGIASRWEELQGSGSWYKLMHPWPLDADLRASLIAYGELAEAAYDGFNYDENSPDAGACLYSRAELLAASGVSHPEHYTVTKFLYATCDLRHVPVFSTPGAKAFFLEPAAHLRDGPWWRQSNWIGYVAVATDQGAAALGRRDIVVAWRGTVENLEKIKDVIFASVSAEPVLGPSAYENFSGAMVHGGFLSVYTAKDESSEHNEKNQTSAREQALEEVRRLMEVHKDEVISITVTGHSLGAALATLNAVDMVGKVGYRACPVTAVLFACPHVGNKNFKDAFASFPNLRVLHVKNDPDMVPRLPTHEFGYVDAATATLHINTDRSPYLRPGTVGTHHNLECYLHGLAGHHGAGNNFKLVVDRNLALVNKGTNALKDEYPVPANWWVTANTKYKVNGVVARFKLDNFKEE